MRDDDRSEWLRQLDAEHAQDDIELAEANARRDRERRERLERKLADPTLSRSEKREAIQNERDLQRFSRNLDAAVDEYLGNGRREDDMPPLITTDDVRLGAVEGDVVEQNVVESKPRRRSFRDWRHEVYDEHGWVPGEDLDDDPVVRSPRRPGAASRFVSAVPALIKGVLIGAVGVGLVWLLALWGLSSLFGWHMWGVGLMIGAGLPCALFLVIWCAMTWDDVSEYVRSGGRRPFHRYY